MSQELAQFFEDQGWEYKREWLTKSGKAIDYLVKAPYDGGYIFFGVECKKDLNHDTNITIFADYLEQASAYARDLELPVFLAPFDSHENVSGMYYGGTQTGAVQSLIIFGGRQNVGGFVRQVRHWGGQSHVEWFSVLRGAKFWDMNTGFNPKRLNIVCSTGSSKERKELKIWR